MDGFDIRTLAMATLLLGIFLGINSFIFARVHTSFSGFKQLGVSYFLFSFGFLLIGLRQYIPDYLTIILANFIIAFAFSLLVLGILQFFQVDEQTFKKITALFLSILVLSFIYYTYYEISTSKRVIVISTIIAGQSIFAALKVLSNSNGISRIFSRLLAFAFIVCALFFLLRVYAVVNGDNLNDFMKAGTIHALSLLAIKFVTISSFFSLALSASQQLAAKLAIEATIDSLTQVYNRRAFDDFAMKEVQRAQRDNTPISLIMMDVDLFKLVNDQYGHQVGDKVLQEFSQRLKNSLRQYDILARYGGEEFTLLLPNTGGNTAMLIAEKLRVKIAQPVFYLDGKEELSVTASFGVVSKQGEHIDWQQLISHADKALYQAKEDGRNCAKLF